MSGKNLLLKMVRTIALNGYELDNADGQPLNVSKIEKVSILLNVCRLIGKDRGMNALLSINLLES